MRRSGSGSAASTRSSDGWAAAATSIATSPAWWAGCSRSPTSTRATPTGRVSSATSPRAPRSDRGAVATTGSADRLPGGAQCLAGLDDAGGHAGLRRLAPRARVVGLLVADLAVDLQHTVVVAEHVRGDRPGEGVLGVGVDVHLHDAVVDRRADVLGGRARSTVEDQVERARALALAELLRGSLLGGLEDLGTQLHVARL